MEQPPLVGTRTGEPQPARGSFWDGDENGQGAAGLAQRCARLGTSSGHGRELGGGPYSHLSPPPGSWGLIHLPYLLPEQAPCCGAGGGCWHPAGRVHAPPACCARSPSCKKPPQVRGPDLRAAGFASRGSPPLPCVPVPPRCAEGLGRHLGNSSQGPLQSGAASRRVLWHQGNRPGFVPKGEHAPGAGGECGVGLGSDRGCGAFIKCARPTPCPPLPLHAGDGVTEEDGGVAVGWGPRPSTGTSRVQGAPAPHVTEPRGCLAPLCSGR